MTLYTASMGFPKPEGTDPISQGYAAIGALADAVDTTLAGMANAVIPLNFSASTTLTADTLGPARKLWIRCLGGGGAGGGATATNASQNSVGGGGQAGVYAESFLTVASLVFPLAITVGAAGAAVTGAAGGDGGVSRVRDNNGTGTVLVEAAGGQGGPIATGAAGTTTTTARGNTAGVGQIVCPGAPGFPGLVPVFEYCIPGYGGSSVFGGGGSPLAGLGNLQGQGGLTWGAGGSGSSRRASNTALPGGGGHQGLVMILAIY